MLNLNIEITSPKLARNPKAELRRFVEGAVYAATVAYANAAAAAVPMWTGYTRAIWLGVARRAAAGAQRRGVTPPAITIVVAGRPWYAPPMPVKRPSKDVLDSPAAQRAKGLDDSKLAFSFNSRQGVVTAEFEIPEYDGEENYAIQEENATDRGVGPWNSMVAGRVAFSRALNLMSRQLKLGGLKTNG